MLLQELLVPLGVTVKSFVPLGNPIKTLLLIRHPFAWNSTGPLVLTTRVGQIRPTEATSLLGKVKECETRFGVEGFTSLLGKVQECEAGRLSC